MTVKLVKCSFGVQNAEQIVNHTALRPSDTQIESFRKLTEQASGNDLMQLLGLVNFFAAFVDLFRDSSAVVKDSLRNWIHKEEKTWVSDWLYRTKVSGEKLQRKA